MKILMIITCILTFLFSSCTNYEPWIRQGISENEADSWMDLEIKPDEAGLWHSIKVSPKDSIKWKDDEFGVGRVQPQNNAMDWVKKGFNRKSSTSWREQGFDPENASNWKSNNFNLQESVSWKKKGFSPSEANAWNENDFSLKESVSWKKEGFNSSSAKEWTDENIALSDASIWSKESFTASESKVWIDKGFSPAKAKIYKDWLKEGFSLEEADKWMKIEENPSVAKAWKELEISFERVKQAKAQNISASEYKEYSGIGYDIGTMVLAKSNSISANEAKGWSKEGYDLENTIEAKKSGKNLEKVQEEHKNSRIVIATGTGVNEKEAIQEAGRNAVKKAVGFYMTSETALENDELIKDEILTYSSGFVTGFKVLSQEKDEDDLINIKASVKVAFRRLNTKLKNMNILGDLGKKEFKAVEFDKFAAARNFQKIYKKIVIDPLYNPASYDMYITDFKVLDVEKELDPFRHTDFETTKIKEMAEIGDLQPYLLSIHFSLKDDYIDNVKDFIRSISFKKNEPGNEIDLIKVKGGWKYNCEDNIYRKNSDELDDCILEFNYEEKDLILFTKDWLPNKDKGCFSSIGRGSWSRENCRQSSLTNSQQWMNNWDLTGVYKLSKKHKKSVKALNKRFLCEGKSNFHRYRTICDTSPINYYRIEITDKNSDVIKFGNNFLNIPDDTKISDKLIIRSKPLLSFPFPDNRYVSKRNKSWIINPGFMPGNDDSPIMIFHKNIFETTYVLWLDIETVDKMNEINIYNKILCNNIDWERAVTKGYIQKNEGKFYVNNSEFTRVYKKREKYIINAKRLDLNNPALNTGYINNEQNRIIPRFSCLPHK